MPAPTSDPSLQYLQIRDFSPGVVRFSRGSYQPSYSTQAPVGSAATAYRCMALPNIGLAPLPFYRPSVTFTGNPASYTQYLSLGNMMALSQSFGTTQLGDSMVMYWYGTVNASPVQWTAILTRANLPYPATGSATIVNLYSTTGTSTAPSLNWPTMDRGVFQDPTTTTAFQQVILTTDPGSLQWVTVGDWQAPSGTPPAYAAGANPGPPTYDVRIFYHTNRAVYIAEYTPAVDTAGFGGAGGGVDGLWVSNLLSLSGWNFSGIYFPEMGFRFGAWGSISTGELFMVYDNGGAILIYGDVFAPSQVVKLPGVVGPGHVWGAAALTPAGLCYATETDGVYMWNGDNTAQKISSQIPDDQLYRTGNTIRLRSSQVAWGAQVMFPNNWLYDTITASWWQVEDPAVVNFQVHAQSVLGPKAFYSCGTGQYTVGPGVTPTMTIYQFDRLTPQPSYFWLSNPLSVTQDALVTIALVEVVASNPTPTVSTITVLPQTPAGQTSYQNMNGTQPLTFTIPPYTEAYRGSQRLGYTDFNVQLSVTAVNAAGNSAPILHELNVGYTQITTAGVQ